MTLSSLYKRATGHRDMGEIEVFTWGDRDWKHVQTLDLENEPLRSGEMETKNRGDI